MHLNRKTCDQNNRFLPQIEALEDRQLLSTVFIPHGLQRTSGSGTLMGSVLLSHEPSVLRTGGAAFLEGSVLHVDLSLPSANQAEIQADGRGDVTVEWNGHTPPTFHGVSAIVVETFGESSSINFTLTSKGTRTQEVDLHLAGNDTVTLNLRGFQAGGPVVKIGQAVDAFIGHGQQSDSPISAAIGSATGGAGAGKIK
jgi:hypothetical protein